MLALLAACTTPAPLQNHGAANAFSCTGRFALIVTQTGGEQKAVQGGFSWLDSDTGYLLDLTNPLGSVQARVEGSVGQAVLTKADGTRLEAADADTLLEQALGSKVPVAGLRYWLRGDRVPDSPVSNVARDSLGRLVSFEQDGWQVQLSRHDTLGPRLLVLERIEADRRIMMRLVVNRS
jgi:outer membrane lipoprotein LolB